MDLDNKSQDALAEVGRMFKEQHKDFKAKAQKKYETLSTKMGPIIEVVNWSNIDWFESMVIDFGCGNGELSQLIKPKGYVGVDISTKKIENLLKTKTDKTYFVCASLTEFVLPRKADFGYCINTFECLPEDYLQKAFLTVSDAVKNLVVCIDLNVKDWHETKKEHSWWMNELSYYFDIGEFKLTKDNHLFIICNQKQDIELSNLLI